jgi:hypothetical protein
LRSRLQAPFSLACTWFARGLPLSSIDSADVRNPQQHTRLVPTLPCAHAAAECGVLSVWPVARAPPGAQVIGHTALCRRSHGCRFLAPLLVPLSILFGRTVGSCFTSQSA